MVNCICVISRRSISCTSFFRDIVQLLFMLVPMRWAWLTLLLLMCGFSALAQTEPSPRLAPHSSLPAYPAIQGAIDTPQEQQKVQGTISGSVVSQDGVALAGIKVQLVMQGQSASQEVLTSEDGRFSFTNVAPESFQLTISSEGFSPHTSSGVLHSAENLLLPQISMVLATNVTKVRVELSPIEIAQEQMNDETKQRVLGVIPNFYVSYVPNAAPLTPKQKFELAWKTTVDPVTFGLNGAIAGIQEAQNDFPGYGQGAQGFLKRYGASYADLATETFIGGAILPSLLKQDPRYFYKGSGSKRSRFLYAIANAVICKGDDGRWQANYSGILGSIAAGGISNLYYPAQDRNGAALTFENALIEVGETAAANLLQEFVVRRLTPGASTHPPVEP